MINFIKLYNTTILYLLNIVFWSLIYFKFPLKSVNKLSVRNIIFFFGIFFIWNCAMIISKRSNFVYIFFWVIVSIYELFFILNILFKLAKAKNKFSDIFVIIISILAIPITLAAILTWTNRTYSPINTTDFYNIILLMLGSILIIRNLLAYDKFLDYIESFFIFSGFILYFGLHILASNALSIDFLKHFKLGTYATLISLIFWLGSVFFIWRIRSKHLL